MSYRGRAARCCATRTSPTRRRGQRRSQPGRAAPRERARGWYSAPSGRGWNANPTRVVSRTPDSLRSDGRRRVPRQWTWLALAHPGGGVSCISCSALERVPFSNCVLPAGAPGLGDRLDPDPSEEPLAPGRAPSSSSLRPSGVALVHSVCRRFRCHRTCAYRVTEVIEARFRSRLQRPDDGRAARPCYRCNKQGSRCRGCGLISKPIPESTALLQDPARGKIEVPAASAGSSGPREARCYGPCSIWMRARARWPALSMASWGEASRTDGRMQGNAGRMVELKERWAAKGQAITDHGQGLPRRPARDERGGGGPSRG